MILDALVTAAFAPLLIIQAMRLRKRALKLPEAAGPRSATAGTGPPLRVLIIGDSSAAGVGVQTQTDALAGQLARALAPHNTVQWHLIARTGATTQSTLAQLQNEILPSVEVALIILGVNDVTHGAAQKQWLRQQTALRDIIGQRTGAQSFYVSQIPPLGQFPLLPNPLRWLLGRRARRFDTALQDALQPHPNSTYVALPQNMDTADMAEDGFHPGPKIYEAWAKEMARQILSDGPH